MRNIKTWIISLLLAIFIVGIVFVSAASAKNSVDEKEKSSGLFGTEIPESLKGNLIQVSPHAFTAASDIKDKDSFFAAYDAYEEKAISDENNKDTAILAASATSNPYDWDRSGTDSYTKKVGSSKVVGSTYFHGVKTMPVSKVYVTLNGYNKGRWYGTGNPNSIKLDTSVEITGISISFSVPASLGATTTKNKASFSNTFTKTSQATQTYDNIKASSSIALTDFDQNDAQTFKFGNTAYITVTHVDL